MPGQKHQRVICMGTKINKFPTVEKTMRFFKSVVNFALEFKVNQNCKDEEKTGQRGKKALRPS